ncbi:MAG: HD domain-containing protein [Lachnospiraceae bacterium]|nr:HD domain-containing protein [Lachnospiraceae bacterium]
MKEILNETDKELFRRVIQELTSNPKIFEMKKYIQHSDISTFTHCLRVARKSLILARRFNWGVNREALIRGAMLHDYFLYDWHTKGDGLHGFHHPFIAAKNARRDFALNDLEYEIIRSHMWPLTLLHFPKSREAFLVSLADKICSADEVISRIDRRFVKAKPKPEV